MQLYIVQCSLYTIQQGSPTYGPRAKCGPFQKNNGPFQIPGSKKKVIKKNLGKIGEKTRVDDPHQKKLPNFPIFWLTYHKSLATPAIQYTLYSVYCIVYIVQSTLYNVQCTLYSCQQYTEQYTNTMCTVQSLQLRYLMSSQLI